jgi:Dyp-type peroxidase family
MAELVEPVLDVKQIQGNIFRGFGTPLLQLAGYKIDDASRAREWLAELAPLVWTIEKVHAFRLLRTALRNALSREQLHDVLMNLAFSANGLRELGISVDNIAEGLFLLPMGMLAGSLGDRIVNERPVDYKLGSTWDDTPDVLFLLGSQTANDLDAGYKALDGEAQQNGCRNIYEERGAALPNKAEHFGYRDGIAIVGPRGRLSDEPDDFLTPRLISASDPLAKTHAKPGQALVWPGQFVFGYPMQKRTDPLTPGPIADGGESWMTNGSFLVFRRLRQDVSRFREFLSTAAVKLTKATGKPWSARQVGAALVGRWEDGTPTSLSPDAEMASISGDPLRVNYFNFSQAAPPVDIDDVPGQVRQIPGASADHEGIKCPFAAHIRKVNPRDTDTDQGPALATLTFHMLRRGIPFGPLFVAGEGDPPPERGLLFLAYQTSFDQQLRLLNTMWMNNPDAPLFTGEGHDPIVGQIVGDSATPRFLTIRGARLEASDRWVIPTGGAFLFAPSIDCLRSLSRRTSGDTWRPGRA